MRGSRGRAAVRYGRRERGAVSVVAAGVILVLLVLVLLTFDAARLLAAAARAQTAADAAALAAAQELAAPSGRDPTELASAFAEANRAVLLACECPAGAGEAVVRVRAAADPTFLLPVQAPEASARAVVVGSAG